MNCCQVILGLEFKSNIARLCFILHRSCCVIIQGSGRSTTLQKGPCLDLTRDCILRYVRNHLTRKMSVKLMGSGIQCFLNMTARKQQVLEATHL